MNENWLFTRKGNYIVILCSFVLNLKYIQLFTTNDLRPNRIESATRAFTKVKTKQSEIYTWAYLRRVMFIMGRRNHKKTAGFSSRVYHGSRPAISRQNVPKNKTLKAENKHLKYWADYTAVRTPDWQIIRHSSDWPSYWIRPHILKYRRLIWILESEFPFKSWFSPTSQ